MQQENSYERLRREFAQVGFSGEWREWIASAEIATSLLRLNLILRRGAGVFVAHRLQQEATEEVRWEFLQLDWRGVDFRDYFIRQGVEGDLLDMSMDKLGFLLDSVAIYDQLQRVELLPVLHRLEQSGLQIVEGYLIFDFGEDAPVKTDLPDWIYDGALWVVAADAVRLRVSGAELLQKTFL